MLVEGDHHGPASTTARVPAATVRLTTGGAERFQAVLDRYDVDPDGPRLADLLVDLAEYAEDAGLQFTWACAAAKQRADRRRRQQ